MRRPFHIPSELSICHSAHDDVQIVCRCHELVEGKVFFSCLVYLILEGPISSHTLLFCCDNISRPGQNVSVCSFASFRFIKVELFNMEHCNFRM